MLFVFLCSLFWGFATFNALPIVGNFFKGFSFYTPDIVRPLTFPFGIIWMVQVHPKAIAHMKEF